MFLSISFVVAAVACHAQSGISAPKALEIAAKNRPALQAARVGIQSALASARAMGAYAPLTIGLGASSNNQVGATDQDLVLSQSFDFFGRRRAGRRAGEAGVQLALAEYRTAATELQADVLTAFAEVVAARHQSEVAEELLKIANGLLLATQRRFDEGKVAEIQVTRASIEAQRAKQSAALRSAEYQASLTRFAGILRTDPSGLEIESDATIEPLVSPQLGDRPDLLTLRAQASIAEAEASVVRADRRPEFSVQMVRTPWGSDPNYFVARAQITWALFDNGRAKNEALAAQRRADAAAKLLDDSSKRAGAEIEAVQLELAARQDRIRSCEAILTSARDLVAKSLRGYSAGIGTQIDFLEASRALREVELELVEARKQVSLAVIAQYRAAGFLAEVLR